jgi:hypothetical protein
MGEMEAGKSGFVDGMISSWAVGVQIPLILSFLFRFHIYPFLSPLLPARTTLRDPTLHPHLQVRS